MSAPLPQGGVRYVRISIELAQKTGYLQVRPAIRYTDDGASYDAVKELVAAWTTTNGTTYGTTWIDITTLDGVTVRTLFQLGVQAGVSSGTANELGMVALRVEFRGY